jgi:hypothetical protein
LPAVRINAGATPDRSAARNGEARQSATSAALVDSGRKTIALSGGSAGILRQSARERDGPCCNPLPGRAGSASDRERLAVGGDSAGGNLAAVGQPVGTRPGGAAPGPGIVKTSPCRAPGRGPRRPSLPNAEKPRSGKTGASAACRCAGPTGRSASLGDKTMPWVECSHSTVIAIPIRPN